MRFHKQPREVHEIYVCTITLICILHSYRADMIENHELRFHKQSHFSNENTRFSEDLSGV